MDPVRIAVRVLFAWCFALALIRVSGKRTVKQGDVPSFVVAVVIGDLFDDFFWAEVAAAEFVVGAGVLVFSHLLVSLDSFKRGSRLWRRAAGAGEST